MKTENDDLADILKMISETLSNHNKLFKSYKEQIRVLQIKVEKLEQDKYNKLARY